MENNPTKDRSFTVNMQPVGRRIEVTAGQTLLDAARNAGVEIISICGGIGSCDSCKIRVISGDLSPLTLEEQALFSQDELDKGYRLACQAIPQSDVKIDIPPESLTTPQRLQIEDLGSEIDPSPDVWSIDLEITPPNINDLRSDSIRLLDAIYQYSKDGQVKSVEYGVLETISNQLRDANWRVRSVVRGDSIIAILPLRDLSGDKAKLLGFAADIGTTKLAAYLIDIASGKILAKTGAMNPQIAYGEDVISRIAYANKFSTDENEATISAERKILQQKLVNTLNDMIAEMLSQLPTQYSTEQIADAVVVGNTVMHHFFAGLPVHQLGTAPFIAALSEALDLRARDVGLRLAPGAYIHIPPNIAGYVGADHVSMLLATVFDPKADLYHTGDNAIVLDIGTNTEISLVFPGGHLSCSCASGPAFEGAHIHDGMRAAPGAIERVQIEGGNIRIKTINNQPAVGICGSGIMDAISELLKEKIIDSRGAINSKHPGVHIENGHPAFLLVPANQTGHGRDIVITRNDVNEIQLAKSAIRTGVELLLFDVGLSVADIDSVIVAGAFGTYIDIQSAIRVGMFPDLPLARFHQVGNAAGTGARHMLISLERRSLANQISQNIRYIELSNHPRFTDEFSQQLFFPPGNTGRTN